MTKEEFDDINDVYKAYLKTLKIDIDEEENLYRIKYSEELTRFFKSDYSWNEIEALDSICNMFFICLKIGQTMGHYYPGNLYDSDTFEKLTNPLIFSNCLCSLCDEIRCMGYIPYDCLKEKLKEFEDIKYSPDYKSCKKGRKECLKEYTSI